jgi:hypothetical protein
MRTPRCLAWIACALGSAQAAAAVSPDPAGLWYDPAESGWGLSISQQGDKLFAVLFVYDTANRPVWYVASDIDTSSGTVFTPLFTVSGKLYRTAGPWFGGVFDPHAVTVTEVGTLTLRFAQPTPQPLGVSYIIDGTTVEKIAQPQTFGTSASDLVGNFEGGLQIMGRSSTACADPGLAPPASVAFKFQGTATGLGQFRFLWGRVDTFCAASGSYTQKGQLGSLSGRVGCAAKGNTDISSVPAPDDPQLQLDNLVINEHGFSGAATVQSGTCTYSGSFGGVRLPD